MHGSASSSSRWPSCRRLRPRLPRPRPPRSSRAASTRAAWPSCTWLRPKPSCPTCGQPIERPEEGYWLGALLVNLVVAELLPLGAVVGVLLATWPHPPWTLLLYGGAALAAISPFVFYPFSKLAWLAVDIYIQPTIDRR